MRIDESKLDALLYETARRKTGEADLKSLLSNMGEDRARVETAWATPLPRLKLGAALAAAAVLALILAATLPSFATPVVINGKRYVAVNDEVKLCGEVRSLSVPASESGIVRLGATNQYVVIDEERDEERIYVYAPFCSPADVRNPEAEPGETDEPRSLEPGTVYPVVCDLMVREGPDTAYKELGMLYSGQCVRKVGICGNWAIIEWEDGIAYAFNAYLFPLPESAGEYEPVTLYATEPVNVRALPTSREGSAILGELQMDEAVVCTGAIGEWLRIERDGGDAFVFARYLTAEPRG